MATCRCRMQEPGRPIWPARLPAGGRWLVPGMLLVFMPKCPACLAGYVALATGIGLSLPTAAMLRSSLLVACIASLLLLVLLSRWGRRTLGYFMRKRRSVPPVV